MPLRKVLVANRSSLSQGDINRKLTHHLVVGELVEHQLDEDHPHFDNRCFGPPCDIEGRPLTEAELDRGRAEVEAEQFVSRKTPPTPDFGSDQVTDRTQHIRSVTEKLDHMNNDHWTKLGKSRLEVINDLMPEGSDEVTRDTLVMFGLDINRDQVAAQRAQQSKSA